MSNLPFISSNNRQTKDDKQLVKDILNKYEINSRADIYQALILKYKDLLDKSPNSRIGVVTSNSWFKTSNGKSFFDILAENFDVKYIVYSDVARWFDNADVVSSIIVLENKSSNPSKTQFISLQKDIRHMTPTDITEISNAIILNKEHPATAKYLYSKKEVDGLISSGLSLEALFDNIKWFQKLKDKKIIIPSNKIIDVFRGTRTGGDDIFITDGLMTDNEDSHPYLKSTRHVKSLFIKSTNKYLFYTEDTIEKLNKKHHTKTLEYINSISNSPRAKKQKDKHGDRWYIPEDTPKYSDFCTTINPDKRLFWGAFEEPTAVNQRVVAARVKQDYAKEKGLIHALLNSVISLYALSGLGFARAEGVTDLTSNSVKNLMILNPDLLTQTSKNNILKKWNVVKDKNVVSIFDTLKDPDWITFNKEIIKSYNLNDNLFDEVKDEIFKLLTRRDNIKNSKS